MSIMEGPAVFKGEDYTGRVFGSYRVLGLGGKRAYPSGSWCYLWSVECLDCGVKKNIASQHARNAKLGCSECKGLRQSAANSPHWRGGTHVPGYFVAQAKAKLFRASKTLVWELSYEDLDSLCLGQDGKCAYTGWPLVFGTNSTEQTASLDRIDSDHGYVPGNVQFVHKKINIMKWSLSEEEFLSLCRAVVENVD